MRFGYARTSLLWFGISVILFIALTAFERSLVGTSLSTQRIITFVALVLPSATGAVFGILSLSNSEGRTALAVTGIVLNTIFALFHLLIVLFAG